MATSLPVLQRDRHLSTFTTLGVGGPARETTSAMSRDEVIDALHYARGERLAVLPVGGGSNMLVADEGFDGLVLSVDD